MNKLIQNLFVIIFPFYPLWAWVSYTVIKKPIDVVVHILFIPFALHFLMYSKKKFPKYLVFFILFTIYHLCVVYLNNLVPDNMPLAYFILSDINVFACTLLIVIENTSFFNKTIVKLNRYIFIIVVISMIVSIIQIKYPLFFFNVDLLKDLVFLESDNRKFSIYSWVSLNSGGVTFPILIAILLNIYDQQKVKFLLLVLSGIVVPFLTKGRYVMISALVAFSQLFINSKRSLAQRALILFLFISSIFSLGLVAETFGFDINEVIDNRILEKESDMGSAKTRVASYDVFFIVFPEHPWFGVGPKTRDNVIRLLNGETPIIHIGYLSYLYYYGIVGCSFLFLSIFHLLKLAWSVGKENNFWGSFYGLVTFCFANCTFVYFNLCEMGIIIAVIYIRYFNSLVILPVSNVQIDSTRSVKVETVTIALSR